MTTIFYILLFVTANCTGGVQSWTLDNRSNDTNLIYEQSCTTCPVEMKIVDQKAIDEMVSQRNKGYITVSEPTKIYKVTLENGVFTQKEIRIVPIKRTIEETIKQKREVIEGWKVE